MKTKSYSLQVLETLLCQGLKNEDAPGSPPGARNLDAPAHLQPVSPSSSLHFDLPSSEPSMSPPDQALINLQNADPWFPFLSKPHAALSAVPWFP